MKIRARCLRVDSEEFVLQNEYQVFIPKRNNNDIAKNFIRGKEIELITDLSSGFVVHGTHLQVPTIHRSRLIEPISFKGIHRSVEKVYYRKFPLNSHKR